MYSEKSTTVPRTCSNHSTPSPNVVRSYSQASQNSTGSSSHEKSEEQIPINTRPRTQSIATDIESNAGRPLPLVQTASRAIDRITSRTTVDDTSPPPDGGFNAWMICFLAAMMNFNCWGFSNTFGVLQTHYVAEFGQTPSAISWVGSIQAFLLFFTATFSGRLLDAGYFHQTFLAGSVLQLLGIFGASAAKTYWQIFLSNGVSCGLGAGLIFCPAMSICATNFSTRRSLVLSIIAGAASLGGLIYAAVLEQLIPKIGFPWALRVVGFMVLASLIPANIFIKPRQLPKSLGPIVELAAFKEPAYAIFAAGMFFNFMGSYFPMYYVCIMMNLRCAQRLTVKQIGSYGRDIIGISNSDASSLIMIINGAGLAGRVIPAMIVHRTGPMNLLGPLTVLAGVVVFTWIAVHNRVGMYIFDVIYGFVMSAGQGMFPPSAASLTTDLSKMGVRNGMIFSCVGCGLLIGTPIAGALISADGGQYLYAQIYAGLLLAVGGVLIILARLYKSNWVLKVAC